MAEPLGVPKPIGGDKKDVGGAFMRNPARQTPMGDKPKARGGIGGAAKAVGKLPGGMTRTMAPNDPQSVPGFGKAGVKPMPPVRAIKPIAPKPIGDIKPIGDGPKPKPSGEPKAKPIGDSKPPVKSGGDSKPKGDGGLIKPMPKSDAVAPPPSSDKKRK